MNKRDIFLSFAISLLASVCFELTKSTMNTMKDLSINGGVVFIIILLICICIILSVKLYRYKLIINKIKINGKEYYDIFEDILYYQNNKSRNNIEIDELVWKFDFTRNRQNSMYLDLHAKWVICFTAKWRKVKQIKLGIHGGGMVSEESMKVKMNQGEERNTSNLISAFQREQNDCTFLQTDLSTYVEKGNSSKIFLKYDWEKFIVVDRKDDYLYLFPYAHACGMKRFEMKITHPYKCLATIFVLQYKWGGAYNRIEVTTGNSVNLKIDIPKREYAEKHHIIFKEVDARSVYLVIFEKK